MSRGFCHVVEAKCEAPAGYRTSDGAFGAPASSQVKTKCYVCGEHVCKACSRFVIMGRGRNCRLCLSCIEARAERAKCHAEDVKASR